MNCVRKHILRTKCGCVAAACQPARVVTFTSSDGPGDAPAVIASGSTVADPTTCGDVAGILEGESREVGKVHGALVRWRLIPP